MAIYHLHAKVISRSDGRSATAAAAYRAGLRISDCRTGLTFDYTRRKCVAWRAIAAPADASPWVLDREQLWNMVEQSEVRRDAQVAREIEVAIPIELSLADRLKLIAQFVETEFVDRGMVADIAVHDNDGNPHCHILLTMRQLLPQGFGKKVRDWNDKQLLEGWRESWATHCNRALARSGIATRVDHRTLIAQGINRIAKRHEGVRRQRLKRQLVRREKFHMREQPTRNMIRYQERGQQWSEDSSSRKPNSQRF
jgi:ATP-dependent exoDNAse (exonuclease V) alpha subunit